MITSRKEYKQYIAKDMAALGAKTRHPLVSTGNSMIWLVDPIARYQRLLRRVEYWENCKTSRFWFPCKVWLRWRFQKRSVQLGFSIPLNVCGPGLCILHYGSIVISRHASIGDNCTLNSAVNIGVSPASSGAPRIGDGVYIGPGAKIWNDIIVADGVTIGANSCVSKSIMKQGATVVGVNTVLGGANEFRFAKG